MQFESKPKRKSCPMMRLRLVRACVDGISRLMSWRQPEPIAPPLDLLRKHVVIVGKGPGGKNRAALALANEMVREHRGAQAFFLDWEANRETTWVLGRAVTATGRTPLFFPQQPFNIWAGGEWRPVLDRLRMLLRSMQLGSEAYYRDIAELILHLACRLGNKPPQSPDELLERLDYKTLLDAFGPARLAGIESEDVEIVCDRFRAIFARLGLAFDGERSFATLDAAHFDFSALPRRSAVSAARAVLAQLLHYIKHEKDPERLCFVFVRVPEEVAGDAELALLLELARRHGVVVVLLLQAPEGGGSRAQLARILNSVGTVVVHGDWVRQGLERVYVLKSGSATLVEVPSRMP